MNILITGICGFVGSRIAERLQASHENIRLIGLDNLSRNGSELHRRQASTLCDVFVHGDLRSPEDLEALPPVDWVIDCAALPSVLAGTTGHGSPRQLISHNLIGTLNVLEYCRRNDAGLILLSTSRVYSIGPLSDLDLIETADRYELGDRRELPFGLTVDGITEQFPTLPPLSLYGATKSASETMAMEYGAEFGFPVRINRCGVLAGAGQFARADQGIFSYWVHSHLAKRPLRYIGFGGSGLQVRDCLHPSDVADLAALQMVAGSDQTKPVICNVSGGQDSSMSLRQVTQWCDARFGKHPVESSDQERPFDLPWIILDCSLARHAWQWSPSRSIERILDEIADFATINGNWLEISS